MKTQIKSLSVLAATLVVAATTAISAPSTVVVDEFGIGTYTGIGGVPTPLGPSVVVVDPFTGAAHFSYLLPFLVPPGAFDLLITEPSASEPSDLLRFVPSLESPGTTTLFFYSAAFDGLDAPADIALFPPATPLLSFLETGLLGPGVPGAYSEAGPNGLVYPVTVGGPGSDGNPEGTIYTFISDVPEPHPAVLLLGGLGIYVFIHRMKRKTA